MGPVGGMYLPYLHAWKIRSLEGLNVGVTNFENPDSSAPVPPNVQIWTMAGQELARPLTTRNYFMGLQGISHACWMW